MKNEINHQSVYDNNNNNNNNDASSRLYKEAEVRSQQQKWLV